MTLQLTVAARTDTGRVRRINEDAFLVADVERGALGDAPGAHQFEVGPRGALLAVSDGMGGHKAGEVASALTLASLYRALAGERPPPDSGPVDSDALVERAVKVANRDVYEAALQPGREKMGATLTAVLVDEAGAHIAEIGDSRAYLIRDGAIRQVTHDQSYVQVLLDVGAIAPEEASQSPMRSVILQAMGQKPRVAVALGRLALRWGDCLLLCTDGLSGALAPEELHAVVKSAADLHAACDRLVAIANERGGDDNITVLLAKVSGDLPVPAPGERIEDTFDVLRSFDAPIER
ncbi:MAG TPA: protein phosphatase 2C domain-containing protein [Polyangiaceae bacterium]|nr:protein phosphatase 2C domain-containing protein [Polyangiaceae bacterium]